jgi:hypothetical protein
VGTGGSESRPGLADVGRVDPPAEKQADAGALSIAPPAHLTVQEANKEQSHSHD